MTKPKAIEERFFNRVSPEPNSGCWLWDGAVAAGNKGTHFYGRFWNGSRLVAAHRQAWSLLIGPIPAGSHVLHKCDIPQCVNPDHLFLGSHADNMADMTAKGKSHRGKTHCKRGHPFDEQNTRWVQKQGYIGRQCRTCANQSGKMSKRRLRAKTPTTWKIKP